MEMFVYADASERTTGSPKCLLYIPLENSVSFFGNIKELGQKIIFLLRNKEEETVKIIPGNNNEIIYFESRLVLTRKMSVQEMGELYGYISTHRKEVATFNRRE